MSGVIKKNAMLGQANGPDVELIVSGTKSYATYETLNGYPAIYDDAAGLFCYAKLVNGEYRSTSIPVTSAPPADVTQHARESEQVRARKIQKGESTHNKEQK
jgi:hypothetical protein